METKLSENRSRIKTHQSVDFDNPYQGFASFPGWISAKIVKKTSLKHVRIPGHIFRYMFDDFGTHFDSFWEHF